MTKLLNHVITTSILALTGLTMPANAAAASTTVRVRAEIGWQVTALDLNAGQRFSVTYRSGDWTVDHRSFPRVGPEGYAPAVDRQIFQGCKTLAGQPYGRLLARTGGGAPFAIARNGSFTAPAAGVLALRINDQDRCLGDNAGALDLAVGPDATGGPGGSSGAGAVLYTADWSSGLNGWAGASSWKTLRGSLLNDGTTHDSTPILAPYDTGQITDYAVETRIRVIRSDEWCCGHYESFGLTTRRAADGGGYSGAIRANSTATIGYTDGGFETNEQPYSPADSWHTYRLEVDGNVVTLLADGARILTVTDNRYLTGGLTGLFDDGLQLEVASYRVLRLR
jgi:hypothetical protein